MGKNLILDYVEESPHNTNRAILSQVVDQYVEEVVNSMGPVGASVNADWSQNDETAADYIKNRPFYEEEATYETAFQQNIEETPYTVPVKLIGDASKYRIICNEETIETGITESWKEEGGDYGYYLISTPWVDIKTEYFAEEGGSTTFTTKGDFTVPYDITIQCLKSAIIKQLDEKFIPDTVARTTDVPSIDNTLTIEGAAADAKAVGDAFANISTSTEWNSIQSKPFQEGYNWRLLAKNQNDDNTPIAISEVIYQNPMKFKFVAEDGTEQIVTEGDKGVTVNKPDNGTRFIFIYSGFSGVVEEFDIRGTIGGTDAKIMTLAPTSNHSSLSIYQAKDEVVSILDENSVPSSIARMSDISNLQNGVTSVNGQTGDVTIDIPEVDYPVISVNGQTGKVLLSYENLNNKPFYEQTYGKTICDARYVTVNENFYGNGILVEGQTYTIIFNDIVYESTGHLHYDGPSVAIDWVYEDFLQSVVCTPEGLYTLLGECHGVLTIREGTSKLVTLDDKFISDNIARVANLIPVDTTLSIEGAAADAKTVGEALANIEIPIHSWDTLEDKPFYETEEEVILEEAEFEDGAIKELNIEPNQAYNIKSGSKFYENIYSEILDDGRINLHVSGQTIYDEITITQTNLNSSFYSINFSDLAISGYVGIIKPKYVKTIEEQFIPNTIARTTTTVLEDITEAPTAEQYNAILQVLRNAGILSTN